MQESSYQTILRQVEKYQSVSTRVIIRSCFVFIHIFQLSLLYRDVSVENTHFLFQYCWGSYIPWHGGGSLTIKWTVDLTISGNTMGDHTFNLGKGEGGSHHCLEHYGRSYVLWRGVGVLALIGQETSPSLGTLCKFLSSVWVGKSYSLFEHYLTFSHYY